VARTATFLPDKLLFAISTSFSFFQHRTYNLTEL
jgi:hypothetical protein